MRLRFISVISFIFLQILSVNLSAEGTASGAKLSDKDLDFSSAWDGKPATPPTSSAPAPAADTGGSSIFGANPEHTPVDSSGYTDKTMADYKSSGSGETAGNATGGVSNQVVNTKIETANNFSHLNQAPCESIVSNGGSAAAGKAVVFAREKCRAMRAAVQTCDSIFTGTVGVNYLCHTEKNQSIASTVTLIQAGVGAAGSIIDACNDFGKFMNIAQQGMTAYTLACGGAQVACKMKCGSAKTAIDSFVTGSKGLLTKLATACATEISAAGANAMAVETDCNTVTAQISRISDLYIPKDNAAPFGVLKKAEICVVSIPSLLASGVVGIAAFANAKSRSDKCKEDAKAEKLAKAAERSCENVANKDRADCSCTLQQNKKLSYCATGLVDCGLTENSDKPICICKANPRMKGCEGVSTSIATNSALSSGDGSGLTNRSPGSLTNAPSAAADGSGFPKDTSGNGQDGRGSSLSASSGSSAGLGSDSASSPTEKTSTATTTSKDSANILDSSGGGGGGGFRVGGFGGGSSVDYRNKLKAFADKNGIGSRLAGNSWGDQVTTVGGKSNFDKIKTRYQENKASLLSK